jgi:hypothetical protein
LPNVGRWFLIAQLGMFVGCFSSWRHNGSLISIDIPRTSHI